MPSYSDITKLTLEKLPPQIIQRITEEVQKDNTFYRRYLERRGLVRYYENTKGGASKFWKVFPPYEVKDGMWGVRVEFGRIGNGGQTRVHVENTEDIAWHYYHEKLEEKKRKGYVQKQETNESAKLKHIQTAAKRKLKVPECSHATLTIAGKNKWKCGSCFTVIEFGKSLAQQQEEDVNEAVRYINLGGLDG